MSKNSAYTGRKLLMFLFFASLVIFLLVLGRWLLAYRNASSPLQTIEGREKFLLSLGWEIDRDSEEVKSITLPENMDAVLTEYNKLQLAQGYDLSRHLGENCMQYSYRLKNYENSDQDVYVCIYVQGRQVIGGDIHSNALNGFMHGIRSRSSV